MSRARWRPSPFLLASGAWHLGAAAWCALQPAAWPLALGSVVANHAAITAAGLLPRCGLLGPTLTRLPAPAAAAGQIAITIDDGPDPEVTPQVLAILAEYGALASFFCIGQRVAAAPDLARAIVAAGHAIENHGQCHHTFNSLNGPAAWRREILDAQASIEAATGQRPRFYRPTAGLRNPFLDPVLHALDLRLASWTRRGFDTRSTDPERVFQALNRGLTGGDILLLHDGHAARTASGQPIILEVLPRLLDTMAASGLTATTLRSIS